MRALVWCIGALELARMMPSELRHLPGVCWLWAGGVALWLLVGAVLVVLPLVRVVSKVGGGVKLPGLKMGPGSGSTTRKEE